MPEVRIKNSYSDRKGLSSIDKTIQLKEFSHYSRVSIKNKIYALIEEWKNQWNDYYKFSNYVVSLFANDIFCVPVDSVNYYDVINDLYECIETNEYHDILSIIEYLAEKISIFRTGYDAFSNFKRYKVDLRKEFNDLFEDECIGYRFIGNHIEQISDNEEIAEIKQAIATPFQEKVNNHLDKALALMSETGNKDYENSIKESVTALEGLCALITNKKGVLSDHITAIAKKYSLHPCMEQMIVKLYAYSSDENGIRHENKNMGHNISYNEAKYILVLCCSTINYLISICGKELNL